jgi:hypothetical protein
MISLLDKWLLLGRIVNDDTLPPSAVPVAYVLLNHHNAATGQCDPSRETIAKQINTTTRTVTTVLTALEKRGYIARQIRGQHVSNSYVPRLGIDALADWKDASSLEENFQSRDARLEASFQPGGSDWKNSAFQTGSQLPPNPSIEHVRKKEEGAAPQSVALFPITGGKVTNTAPVPKRDKRLYLAKHGCTIDSYQPDSASMGAWATDKAPLVKNPVTTETVEEIKDVWRRRGENPKDFDATYRGYLRKRNGWAAEKATETPGAAEETDRLYRQWGVT